MKSLLAVVVAGALLFIPLRASAVLIDPPVMLASTALVPPVVQLNVPQRPPPTMSFLVKQGLVSVGLQAVFAGATALIVSVVTKQVEAKSPDNITGDVFIIMASALPTTLAYLFLPPILMTKMADRDLGSIYFQRVFWASGLGSIMWTLAILALPDPNSSNQSLALTLTFGIGGIFLTAAAEVWMGYMDWDSDPPPPPAPPGPPVDVRPPAHAVAGLQRLSTPPATNVSLLSWRF